MMSGVVLRGMLPALVLTAMLAACTSKAPAPVVERGSRTVAPASAATAAAARSGEFHTVKKGETLYSIALEYGQSYRDLAAWNNLEDPNVIRVGQQLRVAPPEGAAVARPVAAPAAVEVQPAGTIPADTAAGVLKREPKGGKRPYTDQTVVVLAKPEEPRPAAPPPAPARPDPGAEAAAAAGAELNWTWPAGGRVIAGYVEGVNKGIDIEGRIGEPVLAAESGKVTYAGSGIRGYGNMIIVQHAGGLSSVYAHNSRLLAKEGQQVTRGQRIAELGDSDAGQAKLHFEIRRQGRPLDPLKLLPPR